MDSAQQQQQVDMQRKPGSRGRWLPVRVRLPLPGVPGPLRALLPGGGGSSSSSSSSSRATLVAGGVSLTAAAAATSQQASSGGGSAAAASSSKQTVPTRPPSDVFAGALARALSQGTIHPLDTLKVRLQAAAPGLSQGRSGGSPPPPGLSKFGRLVPPATAVNSSSGGSSSLAGGGGGSAVALGTGLASLYRGVLGAASGAGIAIGAYFACYGVAVNALAGSTDLGPSSVAFIAGGAAAAGSSVVKVPLAVCIRSVQAGVYPNVAAAARAITAKAGPRGLFTGFAPTLLEDVPDMAVKFAAYESLRQLHARLHDGAPASPSQDFAMGAASGALAAAATTPLDVIKTRMMCAAASRPTMLGAAREVLAASGPRGLLAGLGPRALSNGINSAVFFCFFEAIRGGLAARAHADAADTLSAWAVAARERALSVRAAMARALAEAGGEGGGEAAAGGNSSAGAGGAGWAAAAAAAAAGAGGGAMLLAGAGRGLATAAGCGASQEAELLLAGGGAAGAVGRGGVAAPLSLSLLARASPLRLEDGQLMAAVAALNGVDGSARLEEP